MPKDIAFSKTDVFKNWLPTTKLYYFIVPKWIYFFTPFIRLFNQTGFYQKTSQILLKLELKIENIASKLRKAREKRHFKNYFLLQMVNLALKFMAY